MYSSALGKGYRKPHTPFQLNRAVGANPSGGAGVGGAIVAVPAHHGLQAEHPERRTGRGSRYQASFRREPGALYASARHRPQKRERSGSPSRLSRSRPLWPRALRDEVVRRGPLLAVSPRRRRVIAAASAAESALSSDRKGGLDRRVPSLEKVPSSARREKGASGGIELGVPAAFRSSGFPRVEFGASYLSDTLPRSCQAKGRTRVFGLALGPPALPRSSGNA